MSLPASAYVRYAAGVEVIQPDEARLIAETEAVMHKLRQFTFEQHRHAIRDAHAKSHGVLRGELQVYDHLPAYLAQGMFREPRAYPVIIRLSSGSGTLASDKQSSFKGFAIKALGVPGPKLLPEAAEARTHDWLLVSDPVFPTGDVASYLRTARLLEKLAHAPEPVQEGLATASRLANKALHAVGVDPQFLPIGSGHPQYHILGETFHSMGAQRYGDYVAKLSAAPLSANVRALAGQEVDVDDDSTWRDLVVNFFRAQGAEYELRAQLCTDLRAMPVEDASVPWPAEQSPHQPVARLVIPPQEAYSPARRVYADDVLTFNSFHCLPEHRPLGSINRVRRSVYEASSRYRHEMNARPRREPRDIGELPD